jgi:glycosyltransferase involved in cell wall biosynthesis
MSDPLRILALEPYYGGSHRAFLDGWIAHSRHQWTLLGLPARKWKWRMRLGAVDVARAVKTRFDAGAAWDAVLCSGMLDLPSFVGLAPGPLRALPAIAYFHENQLTYPHQSEAERDYTYGLLNIKTALAAAASWFNSDFHRTAFLASAERLLRRAPDHEAGPVVDRMRCRAAVEPPGIAWLAAPRVRPPGPLRILWAARWEHDKNPETFFEALHELAARGIAFRVDVLGERFRQAPEVFATAHRRLTGRVGRWGFTGRSDYEAALGEADVFVSTANHEFFGLSAVEAAAAGAFPLLPRRLAYPEVFRLAEHPEFFYDGSAAELAVRLEALAAELTGERPGPAVEVVSRFGWARRAPAMDEALDQAVARANLP